MSTPIKAFVFDVYGTLFDVHSVKEECERLYPGKGEALSQSWRKKQIEYSFLRQLMGTYETFHRVTKAALRYAANENEVPLSEQNETQLLEAYLRLSPFPEVADVLKRLSGKTLAVFSNGSHDMLDPLIDQSGLSPFFQHLISVDEVKQYKPVPSSYQHVLDTLGLKKEDVLFMSSNGWDISGAKQFGFQTAWINRGGLPAEELDLVPDHMYSDLTGLLKWT
jgi:2-haloacid dehalogenase